MTEARFDNSLPTIIMEHENITIYDSNQPESNIKRAFSNELYHSNNFHQ